MTKVGTTANFPGPPPAHLLDPGSSPAIRAVLFDLDGTLYRQNRLRSLMALELLTMPLSGPLRAPRRWVALREYRRAQEALRQRLVAGPPATQVALAARASGLPVAEVEALVEEWMISRPLKYLQFCRPKGLERLLDLIARAGIPAGVLSDYPAEAKLRALGLERRFFPVLCAGDPEIGAFKPNPRGYLRACELWGIAPSDVLFVGDRADVDAVGAAAAGMRCVIVGAPAPPPDSTYAVVASLEGLNRVFNSY